MHASLSTEVMYLSKIALGSPAFRNPYEVHRALWRLFPEDAEARRDFLFRVEQSGYSHTQVIMQSDRQPQASSDKVQITACKTYRPILTFGDHLRFFLVANPIKMINDEAERKNAKGEIKKCRVPLLREDEQRVWIQRKLVDAAVIESLAIDPAFPIRFRKMKENHVGRIQPVSFRGTLVVKNPETMVFLIKRGIGPAKTFGCGMLSLART